MNIPPEASLFLLFGFVIVVAIASIFWQFSRSREMLEQWAAENGFQLIEARYRWIVRGPFFWTSSKGQTVYRIAVMTREGHRHTGWARCGGWFFGLFTYKVSVIWDHPAPHMSPSFPVIMRPPTL